MTGPLSNEASPVHITREEFENASFPDRPTVRGNNPSCPTNQRNLKTPAFLFREDGKHFEIGTFRKRLRHDRYLISPLQFFSNTTPK